MRSIKNVKAITQHHEEEKDKLLEVTRKREWERKREEKDASENTKSWIREGREE